MPLQFNISDKTGKTYKLELETEEFFGKELHDKIAGNILLPGLEGYELEITGASDKSGFTAMKDVPGIGLKKVLLSYEKGMKRKPKREGKTKFSNDTPKGLKLRKTVRGKVLSPDIRQINLKVITEGAKKLAEVFQSSDAPKEEKTPAEEKPKEKPIEEPKKEDAPKEEPKPEENA